MIVTHDVNKIVDMTNDCAQRGIAIAFTVGAQNALPKLTPATPPLSRIASSCRSVRLRGCGHSVWALEWVATSGEEE